MIGTPWRHANERRPRDGTRRVYALASGQWCGVVWDRQRGVWAGGVLPGVHTRVGAVRALRGLTGGAA